MERENAILKEQVQANSAALTTVTASLNAESERISSNEEKIERNSVAISENSANISANSDITGQVVEIVDICVNDYFSQSGEYCGEWVGSTIEKLPLWGLKEPGDGENTFEWPTQADWATMSPDV